MAGGGGGGGGGNFHGGGGDYFLENLTPGGYFMGGKFYFYTGLHRSLQLLLLRRVQKSFMKLKILAPPQERDVRSGDVWSSF